MDPMPPPDRPNRPVRPTGKPASRPASTPRAPAASRSPSAAPPEFGMRRPTRAPPPPKRKPPVVAWAIGGAALVAVAAAAFIFLRGGKGDAPKAGPVDAGASSAANPTAATAAPGDSKATPAGTKAEPTKPPPPPPPPPKLDAAAVDQRLAELATAADVIAYGALRKSQGSDAALADRCYEKALALEPANETAKQRLDVRKLSPTRALPGWDDVAVSKAAWRARPFEALAGVEMSRPERAKRVAAWEEARKALDERIALEE